jgi:hypothetical protein
MEVKSHPWFDGFPWDKLDSREIIAPFIPESTDNFDVKVTNDGWKDEESEKMQEAGLLLRRETVQDLFKGYYYDQSFESFGYNIEEKQKERPIVIQKRKQAHRTTKNSVERSISNSHKRSTRSNSGKGRALVNIQNINKSEHAKPSKQSI